MTKIQLGDKVKDKITGFVGIVVHKTEFLNGCVQYGVQGQIAKENIVPEPVGIDEQSLEVLKPKEKKVKKEKFGGPNRLAFKFRGF